MVFVDRLLAKAWSAADRPPPDEATLRGHLFEVLCAAERILQLTGIRQLEAFGLDPGEWGDRLTKAVRLAAAIHDLGKANEQFQGLLVGGRDIPPIRHEGLSVWFVQQPVVKDWLFPAVDSDEKVWQIVLFAVAGHHPKHNRAAFDVERLQAAPVSLMTTHPDFLHCLDSIGSWFGLGSPPRVPDSVVYKGEGDREGKRAFQSMAGEIVSYEFEPRSNREQWQALCALTKACLIGADVAGSALWEKLGDAQDRTDWIEASLGRNPKSDDFSEIVNDRLGGAVPREFQSKVAQSCPRDNVTLLEAGCGTGKTLAAYLWARDQTEGRRLWFCYPTTGTATEGFRDYLCDTNTGATRAGTDLFHSRAELDKQLETAKLLVSFGEEELKEASETDDVQVRINSLIAWDTMIVSCTVDQVLGILQNHRSGLYAWPALAQSALVFDEIHCYDDLLFGNLLTFLTRLKGLPVLLMTASLPEGRRTALEKACSQSGRKLEIVSGPEDRESLPRYIRVGAEPTAPVAETEEFVRDAIAEQGRVLWISNTVDRCRDVGRRLEDCESIVYHSRFIYLDRQARHREVVALFASRGSGFASTTQVAEVSLDLKHATLLVTELAPISALIQRLGRLNRHAGPEQPASERPLGRFLVIDPIGPNGVTSLPYDDAELEAARCWLTSLGNGELSQRDLIRVWKESDHSLPPPPECSAWITGQGQTIVGPIRKSSYGITVIMQDHVQDAKKKGATAYLLPMNAPQRKGWDSGRRCSNYPVARQDAISYDAVTGGEWATFFVI